MTGKAWWPYKTIAELQDENKVLRARCATLSKHVIQLRKDITMNRFWLQQVGDGHYEIGVGAVIVVTVEYPHDYLAAQWAQCVVNALNDRRTKLTDFAKAQNEDSGETEAEQAARDKHNAMKDDARNYGPEEE